MSNSDEETIEKAVRWVEENRERIVEEIVFRRALRKEKECLFMAGSPGAGKTETVRELELGRSFTILEADEIREMNPFYERTEHGKKGNAHLIQKASGLGLNYCRERCIEKGIAFVQDATFQNKGSRDLVKRLLKAGWKVGILFIFQDPKNAWEFVKAREQREGRGVPKESFAESFVGTLRNLEYVQKKHPEVEISLTLKDGREIKKTVLVEGLVREMLENLSVVVPSKDAILESIEGEGLSN